MRNIIIVGCADPSHVGSHLLAGAMGLQVPARLVDTQQAFCVAPLLQKLSWHILGRRPPLLKAFGRKVCELSVQLGAMAVITTGIAPLSESALQTLSRLNIPHFNFLTDDPWNKAHYAPWFMKALRKYTRVFSPRTANLQDLLAHGCTDVQWLPFGYSPEVHFPDKLTAEHKSNFVGFVGGADNDRVPYFRALKAAHIPVALYGHDWNNYDDLVAEAYGRGNLQVLRSFTASATVTLCLVRRANRDGHVMRTFEAAASQGCILAEQTQEHLKIYGPEGETVRYFADIEEMITKYNYLLYNPAERLRMRAAVYRRITLGHNTYMDRLKTMLGPLAN